MVKNDRFYLLSSDEINSLYSLLDDDNADFADIVIYLDFILSTKTMTVTGPADEGLMYFD